MKKRKLTPLKSARAYCMWCCDNHKKEITLCPSIDCHLYNYRKGKKTVKGSIIKEIRKKCIDCVGSYKLVSNCMSVDCPLYAYRKGKSPAHQELWENGHRNLQIKKQIVL